MEGIIGLMGNGQALGSEDIKLTHDTCNKLKVTRHHASREKRPLRYPPYGPEVAIPKEVPILGAETRVLLRVGHRALLKLNLPGLLG